jgi:hypothetical protein
MGFRGGIILNPSGNGTAPTLQVVERDNGVDAVAVERGWEDLWSRPHGGPWPLTTESSLQLNACEQPL